MKLTTIVYILCHLSLVHVATIASRPFRFKIRPGYVLKQGPAVVEYMADCLLACCSLCGMSNSTALSWHGDSRRCLHANVKGIPIPEDVFEEGDGWTSYDLLPAAVSKEVSNSFHGGLNEFCESVGLNIANKEDVMSLWRRGFHGCTCILIEGYEYVRVTQYVDMKCFPYLRKGVHDCSYYGILTEGPILCKYI